MNFLNSWTKYKIHYLFIAFYAFLVFWGLGLSEFWNDEAITAFLANNCLHFGYPKAFDGTNWTDPREAARLGLGPGLSWVAHPWIQYYITAFSFLLLKASAFSGRLPFAIFGFLSIFPFYALNRKLFDDKKIAFFSCLVLITCVSFLLHLRQCRYYALVVFFTLVLVNSYFGILSGEKKRFHKTVFLLGSFFFFYSNHATFIPAIGSLGLYHLLFQRTKIPFKELFFYGLIVIAFATPWFIITHHSNVEQSLVFSFELFRKNLEFQFRVINKYLMPLVFFGVCFLLGTFVPQLRKRLLFPLNEKEKQTLIFIGLFLAVHIFFFCFVKVRTIRYFIHLVPVLALLQGLILAKWFGINRWFTIVITALLIFTNLLTRPNSPHFYFLNYLYEITHDYDGPVEAIVNYLRTNAKPGDTVKIIYGDAQVMYALPHLKLENDYFYENLSFPDFIVDRYYWRREEELKMERKKEDTEKVKRYWGEIAARYDQITLNAVDLIWENRPDDMEYHKFRTVTEGRKVVIYKKKKTPG